jgi:SAM-dependent methyltransferase
MTIGPNAETAVLPGHSGQAARSTASRLRALVAIASYGTKQDHLLAQVLAAHRDMPLDARIVVLSDRPRTIAGAEVLVGLPSRNPYSLPFAHRKLFAAHVEHYDLFIYSEDDTLLTRRHLEAWLALQPLLDRNEILGFLRSETTPSGESIITSVNHFFRWRADSVQVRGGEAFARFTNDHSGCFIATRSQLRTALASGGFVVKPHDERYGMLESAASDIYTQCGLNRLLCVSRLTDFVVPHLANKYFDRMGIPAEELWAQARALQEPLLGRDTLLIEPQTRVGGFRFSKNLYSPPQPRLEELIPESTRTLLTLGATLGRLETTFLRRGVRVHAIPLDGVFSQTLRGRGIHVIEGSMTQALGRLGNETFDAIVLEDMLHLTEQPIDWLHQLRSRLGPAGRLVFSVPNTTDPGSWVTDCLRGQPRQPLVRFDRDGVHAVSVGRLRRWLRASRLEPDTILFVTNGPRRERLTRRLGRASARFLATTFLVRAQAST